MPIRLTLIPLLIVLATVIAAAASFFLLTRPSPNPPLPPHQTTHSQAERGRGRPYGRINATT
jgi:hypothetical protein